MTREIIFDMNKDIFIGSQFLRLMDKYGPDIRGVILGQLLTGRDPVVSFNRSAVGGSGMKRNRRNK